ncbi:MAG: RluA family pseudouridine synthase [Saprospiraceae bacterium]|nr:RluA family pseudouridine synthase [Saprospiraceae bacterium]
MYLLDSHIIPEGTPPNRLSAYAVGIFPALSSRKGIKKALKRQQLLVDGQLGQSGTWVSGGQLIQLYERSDSPPKTLPLQLDIPYEDEHFAVVHKPAGLVVSGNQYRTLYNALPFNLKASEQIDALPWPLPVHRLDAQTSGLVVVAKTRSSSASLGKAFENRQIQKTYHCLAIGKTPASGSFLSPLDGKAARTHYKLIQQIPSLRSEYLSLLEIQLETGRTHQIRRHLSEAGYPILGDKLYGKADLVLRGKGLFLVASAIRFQHPLSAEEIEISTDLPPKFHQFLERETGLWEKWGK